MLCKYTRVNLDYVKHFFFSWSACASPSKAQIFVKANEERKNNNNSNNKENRCSLRLNVVVLYAIALCIFLGLFISFSLFGDSILDESRHFDDVLIFDHINVRYKRLV